MALAADGGSSLHTTQDTGFDFNSWISTVCSTRVSTARPESSTSQHLPRKNKGLLNLMILGVPPRLQKGQG